jgi:type III secretion protein U
MSGKDDSGEKTEQATAKRLRDARKDGDVAKSRDLNHTLTLLVWTLLIVALSGYYADQLSALLIFAWTEVDLNSPTALRDVGIAAAKVAVLLSILPLAIVGICGMLAEFLQVGPVFSFKRIAPQMARLNPAEGAKRLFSMDNLFEIAKSLLKTVVLAALLVLLLRQYLPDMLRLPQAGLEAYMGLDRRVLLMLCTWIVALFAVLSVGDRLYQNFSHRKRLRMSKSDIRRERKEEQGDPHIRAQRRRLQRQWAAQNPRQAAREATAVLVNPTHYAVAILYKPEETAVPVITAKGEGNLARLMRLDAEAAGVPVIRDVPLTRALHFHGEEDEFIPEQFFDAVAEVIATAERLRLGPSEP